MEEDDTFMKDPKNMLTHLKSLKLRLQRAEDEVLDFKKAISELETKLEDAKITQLEIDFLAAQEDVQRKTRTILWDVRRKMIQYGKDLVVAQIAELSEETGIPIHLSHERDVEINGIYVPTSAKEKWADINFEIYNVMKNDSRFGGDLSKEGWYFSSSIC